MKHRTSRPLLRAAGLTATVGTSLACAGALDDTSTVDPPSDKPIQVAPDLVPNPSREEPPEHRAAAIHLRGELALVPKADDTVFLEIASPGGAGVRVNVPVEGPWPREFHLVETDLPGLDVETDGLVVTAHHLHAYGEGNHYTKQAQQVPTRASRLQFQVHAQQVYLPELPSEVIPTEEAVRELKPIRPDEPGTRLDLQGVIVYDSRLPKPQAIIVSAFGSDGGAVNLSVEPTGSPLQFRLQDSDNYSDRTFKGRTVDLRVVVRYAAHEDQTVRIEQKALPRVSKTVRVVMEPSATQPWPGRTRPQPMVKWSTADLDVEGTILAPPGTVESGTFTIWHAGGSTAIPLEGPFPRAVHLTGSEWSEVALREGATQVSTRLELHTKEGGHYLTDQSVALDAKAVVWKPEVNSRWVDPDLPKRPVYGNTKGSHHYDDSVPRKQRPPSGQGL